MSLATIIVAAIALGAPSDAAVRADWAAHGNDPALRYLSLDAVPAKNRDKWATIGAYQIPSASRGSALDKELPQRVGQSWAYRIDLDYLHWSQEDFAKVMEKYPYAVVDKGTSPLSLRMDWLIHQIANTRESNAYYVLLYSSAKIPKTDAEFLAFWGVDLKRQDGARFGWVEGKSQVALQEIRFVEHFVGKAGRSVWRTKDVARVDAKSDPLEFLDGEFAHDARELIAQIPKTSARYSIRGAAQVYALANGKGEVQNVAPINIVEDHKRTLNGPELVNGCSCVACHITGMNPPTSNNLKEVLKLGENLYTWNKETAEFVDDFHLGDSGTTIQRNNQDYASFVTAATGIGPVENAKIFRQGLADYRADLSLDRAAGELYCEPNELRLAIAYASANKITMPVRVIGLAHGENVPRTSWESAYLQVAEILKIWQQAGRK